VLRFLSRKLHGNFKGEVGTDSKRRLEGWRIKHRMKRNSIKMYDKVSVLRIETTINNPREFTILRPQVRGRRTIWRWMPMGKGVQFLWRYAELSRLANHRYLEALASAPLQGKAVAELDDLCRSRTRRGRHVPGLNPVAADTVALFQAALDGAHCLNGFRNRDLRTHVADLLGWNRDDYTLGRMTYDLRRLRLKGLIARVPKSHRYTITSYGLRVALFCSKLFLRILRPAWPALLDQDADAIPRPLRAAFLKLDAELQRICDLAQLKTAS